MTSQQFTRSQAKSTTPTMLVPANRVVTLFVDALTADWDKYTVQADVEGLGPVVSCREFISVDICTYIWDRHLFYTFAMLPKAPEMSRKRRSRQALPMLSHPIKSYMLRRIPRLLSHAESPQPLVFPDLYLRSTPTPLGTQKKRTSRGKELNGGAR